jgi:hypothetical protein
VLPAKPTEATTSIRLRHGAESGAAARALAGSGFRRGTGLVGWSATGGGVLVSWGGGLVFRDVMLASRDTVPVTSEGPLVSRCLGVSLSATTGFSVTAGNCAVKRSFVCQRAAMIQASGGGEPSGATRAPGQSGRPAPRWGARSSAPLTGHNEPVCQRIVHRQRFIPVRCGRPTEVELGTGPEHARRERCGGLK